MHAQTSLTLEICAKYRIHVKELEVPRKGQYWKIREKAQKRKKQIKYLEYRLKQLTNFQWIYFG